MEDNLGALLVTEEEQTLGEDPMSHQQRQALREMESGLSEERAIHEFFCETGGLLIISHDLNFIFP